MWSLHVHFYRKLALFFRHHIFYIREETSHTFSVPLLFSVHHPEIYCLLSLDRKGSWPFSRVFSKDTLLHRHDTIWSICTFVSLFLCMFIYGYVLCYFVEISDGFLCRSLSVVSSLKGQRTPSKSGLSRCTTLMGTAASRKRWVTYFVYPHGEQPVADVGLELWKAFDLYCLVT